MSDTTAEKTISEIMRALAAPFPSKDIEWRVGATSSDKSKGMAVAYITNRAVQQRLDEVMGIGNWKNQFEMWRNTGTICGLSLRLGGEWITKWDGADESDMEPTKGGLSDSMKRAAVQWGIGRYLYGLEAAWVPIEQRGRSFVIKGDPPKLPDWALPEAERGQQGARRGVPAQAPQAPATTFTVTAAPTEYSASTTYRKGEPYVLAPVKDGSGSAGKVVAFEEPCKAALRSAKPGSVLSGVFKEASQGVLELVSLSKAS